MKDVIFLIFHLLTTMAKLLQPGGSRTIIAENLLLKQQLIIHSRSRQRAPNLSVQDRAQLGFWALFLNHRRIARSAIVIKPSTLLEFHFALKKRKYRQLYSPRGGRKPGPKGPPREVIDAIVELPFRPIQAYLYYTHARHSYKTNDESLEEGTFPWQRKKAQFHRSKKTQTSYWPMQKKAFKSKPATR